MRFAPGLDGATFICVAGIVIILWLSEQFQPSTMRRLICRCMQLDSGDCSRIDTSCIAIYRKSRGSASYRLFCTEAPLASDSGCQPSSTIKQSQIAIALIYQGNSSGIKVAWR